MIYLVQKDLGAIAPLWVTAGSFTDWEQARAHAVTLWERDVFVVRLVRVEEGKADVVMATYYPTTDNESRRT